VERCKTITHGLLKFSRRVDARPEEVDLHGLLHELALIARTRARVENVLVEVELQPTPPVVAAPAHLQQIFMNLVNNAIDATAGRPEARVTIRSGPEGEGVRVDVVDNGAGIPLQNLSRIFIPFFTTKPVGRGTGLGLAICYGLVQDLGGTIHVESHVGTGTTFTVHLPLAHHPEVQRAEVTWQI
jgi:two-component system NtrC family sensor kinase